MNIGEKIALSTGEYKVEACESCSKNMVDLKRHHLGIGDLLKLKLQGLLSSSPDTDDKICIHCESKKHSNLSNWFNSDSSDDSSFHSSYTPSTSSFDFGSSSGFGCGDSFGGFGGGSFGGGGASGGF